MYYESFLVHAGQKNAKYLYELQKILTHKRLKARILNLIKCSHNNVYKMKHILFTTNEYETLSKNKLTRIRCKYCSE